MEIDPIRMCQPLVGLGPIHVLGVVDWWIDRPLEIHVRTLARTAACPECDVPARLKDVDVVRLVDLPCFGRPTRLVWSKRR